MLKRTPSLLLLIVLALGLGFGGVSAAPANQVSELIIFWAQWPPADYLQEIGNRYEAETGIKVTVIQEPWGSFYDRMSAEWAPRVTLTIWSWATASGSARALSRATYMELTTSWSRNILVDTVTPRP